MTSHLDRMLLATMTRGWDQAKIDAYSGTVHQEDEASQGLTPAFQTIDVKAAGTLTHVSMMIAGLGLIAPMVATHPVEEAVVILQITIYLLIAIGCLRCLSLFNAKELSGTPTQIALQVGRELIIRRGLYAICNRVSIFFTLVVFITLPSLWLFEP